MRHSRSAELIDLPARLDAELSASAPDAVDAGDEIIIIQQEGSHGTDIVVVRTERPAETRSWRKMVGLAGRADAAGRPLRFAPISTGLWPSTSARRLVSAYLLKGAQPLPVERDRL